MGSEFLTTLSEFLKPNVVKKEVEHNGKKQDFYFRELNGEEGTAIFGDLASQDNTKKDKAMRDLRNKAVAAGVCDAEGKSIASEREVGKWPLSLLNKLHKEVLELNGVIDKERDAGKNE